MKVPAVIQSLWIGKKLSTMEKLCLSSFIKNGHRFDLYTYGEVEGVPEGVTIKNAEEILPRDRIFKYPEYDSYAGFANLFRYKLLLEKGHYWVDTDIICLKPMSHTQPYVFAGQRIPRRRLNYVREESIRSKARKFLNYGWANTAYGLSTKKRVLANNCLIKAPKNSNIMEYCFDVANKTNIETIKWGETGPKLLTKAIEKFGMFKYVADPTLFCPINFWEWDQLIDDSPNKSALKSADAVHLWNEMWRRDSIDKSIDFPDRSIYEMLKKSYC